MRVLILMIMFFGVCNVYGQSAQMYLDAVNQVSVNHSRTLRIEVPEDGDYSLSCRAARDVYCSMSLYKVSSEGNLLYVGSDGTSNSNYIPSIHQQLSSGAYLLLLDVENVVQADVEVYFLKN